MTDARDAAAAQIKTALNNMIFGDSPSGNAGGADLATSGSALLQLVGAHRE
jgi:hypothetical protein